MTDDGDWNQRGLGFGGWACVWGGTQGMDDDVGTGGGGEFEEEVELLGRAV